MNTYMKERIVLTIIIWTLTVLALLAAMDMGAVEFMFPLILLVVGAVFAVGFLWKAQLGSSAEDYGKQKQVNTTRVGRMLNDLSDDEIDELRERLLVRDNEESIALESLLDDYRRRSAR